MLRNAVWLLVPALTPATLAFYAPVAYAALPGVTANIPAAQPGMMGGFSPSRPTSPHAIAPQPVPLQPGPLQPAPPQPGPAQQCRAAIAATERATQIPDAFLSAIGRVESGRPEDGAVSPWPWTINEEGKGHFYATKAEAIGAARQFIAGGIRSIDVGCLQVNLFYHPEAFSSLEQAFDPPSNAAYAAGLLLSLFRSTGSWPRAAAAYHSLTPALGRAYQEKVLEAWATPDRPGLGRDTAQGAPRRGGPPAQNGAAPAFATAANISPAAGQAGNNTALPEKSGSLFASPAPRAAQALASMPAAYGFSRRLMIGTPRQMAGMPLAAYRAAPVQFAWRGPAQRR